MKSKIAGAAMFAFTLVAIAIYPSLNAKTRVSEPAPDTAQNLESVPAIDVVFVLDTTGSMNGLIETAKEKIWSIATTMTSAQQTPNIRVGLVGYRDRGDKYVTRVVDLSDDLDSVYASLMDFEAGGGGDGPESVNRALYDAVHNVSWSKNPRTYQAVFLVGDAPPHMDYQDEVQYPEILATAIQKGIVVNTIQCGDIARTTGSWEKIAALGSGQFFQVEQAGSAVAISTPFDEKIARLSEKLDDTRLYYGSKKEKEKMHSKVEATTKLNKHASISSRARRGAFNSSEGGRKNLLGENELVDAVVSGRLDLERIAKETLPEALQSMETSQQRKEIKKIADRRSKLKSEIKQLAEKRSSYIESEVKEIADADKSLDHKLYDAVRDQAASVGLEYREGPKY